MMSLSNREKLELAIFGYVRFNHKGEIPDDITRICLQYYIILYFPKIEIIWDLYCDNIKKCVFDDGLGIKVEGRGPYSTFASSIGWNKGKHWFTVKQLDSKDYQFGMGIISSKSLSKITSKEKENYFMYYRITGRIAYSLDQRGVSKNDTTTCLIDCDEWKVSFYQNEKRIIHRDITKDTTYHAAITVWQGRSVTLKLVDTPTDILQELKEQQKSDAGNIRQRSLKTKSV